MPRVGVRASIARTCCRRRPGRLRTWALLDIAEQTGVAKRTVQDALGWLVKRKLIAIERESITAIPLYTVLRPWKR